MVILKRSLQNYQIRFNTSWQSSVGYDLMTMHSQKRVKQSYDVTFNYFHREKTLIDEKTIFSNDNPTHSLRNVRCLHVTNDIQTTSCKRHVANDMLQTTCCKRHANDMLQTTSCKRYTNDILQTTYKRHVTNDMLLGI